MQQYRCPLCGAVLNFDPTIGKLKCPYCDSTYAPEDFEDKTKKSDIKNEEKEKEFTQSQTLDDNWVIYSCGECGAEVVADKKTMATVCAYCGSPISITSKAADNFRPKKILPYKITKEKAIEIYKKYASSSEFTPNTFMEEAVIEKMQNLFVPFYMNSMRVEAEATIKDEMINRKRSGDDEIVTTKIYNTYSKAYGEIVNVPTDASKKLDNNMMDALEPFDYNNAKDFNPAYMAGYIADQPDEYPEDMLVRAEQRASEFVDQEMLKTTCHSNKQIIGRNYKFMNEKSEYTMIPIWVLNVKYKSEPYRFAINGETGKIVGKLPIDDKKLRKRCLRPCFIISAISFVIGVLMYIGGTL